MPNLKIKLSISKGRMRSNQGFPGGAVTKNLPAKAGDTRDVGSVSGWEDPLELEIATHSTILAWKIPWTEEPCRLQSTGSQRVGHD